MVLLALFPFYLIIYLDSKNLFIGKIISSEGAWLVSELDLRLQGEQLSPLVLREINAGLSWAPVT